MMYKSKPINNSKEIQLCCLSVNPDPDFANKTFYSLGWFLVHYVFHKYIEKKKALNLAEQRFSSAWKYLFLKVYNISPYCGIAMGLTAMGLVDLAMLLISSTTFY